MEIAATIFPYYRILFGCYLVHSGSNPLSPHTRWFLLVTRFVSSPNIFLNFKQDIARFPQLVRHQVAGQQTITAVPITQSCMPGPIRAPVEGGGAQHMR
jgi:hypothetical protein